jgi:transposase-like protein
MIWCGVGDRVADLEVGGLPDLCRLDGNVGAFRTRQLDHVEFPYVYLATYLHVRNTTSHVVSMALVVATGITANCYREIPGCGD